jgi:hypothetical protein
MHRKYEKFNVLSNRYDSSGLLFLGILGDEATLNSP